MTNPASVNVSLISCDLIKISNLTFHGSFLILFPFTFLLYSFFLLLFWQVTSVLGPIPRNPFQTGKFFQELSEFVGDNPGMF